MLSRRTAYLTCCFLTLPLHASSGWHKKQSERWVIASIFLLHDLCRTLFPINNVWIALLSPPRARENINIRRVLGSFQSIYLFFNFSGRGLRNMHLHVHLPQKQPASYMYRFTRSHQGAACFTKIILFLYLTTVQLHWSSWGVVPGSRTPIRGRRRALLICFPFPDCVSKLETS